MSPRSLLIVVIGVLVVAIAATLVFVLLDDSTAEAPPTSSIPSDAVILPQNPSLRLVDVDGTWQVENDGNVTMSEIEVRDGSDTVICELGELAPDELAPCDAADSATDLTVVGAGPQGQRVEASSG
jgi:hypothetical protein